MAYATPRIVRAPASTANVRIYAADQYLREQHFYHNFPHLYSEQTATLGAGDTASVTTSNNIVGGGGAPNGVLHHSMPSSSQQPPLPENAIYYMGMSSGAVPGINYVSDPYGYTMDYRPGTIHSTVVYPQTVYGPSYGYNAQYGSSYLPYPQPSPPQRRSRTAPSRTLPRGAPVSAYQAATAQRRPRGNSADADRRTMYRAYLGPGKKPAHFYRKSRLSYQDNASFTAPAATVTDYPFHTVPRPVNRTPSIYQPSYTSYPPAQMQFKEKSVISRYPLWLRLGVKGTQLILGAAILGLVLGPMRNTSLFDFVTATRTEWQGVVVGIVGAVTITTLILLFTAVLLHKSEGWRKIDAHCSIIGLILYLLASCIESYYAACYPPNGPRINLVCHRAEWIIATILGFINVIMYVIDFILSWMAGVSML